VRVPSRTGGRCARARTSGPDTASGRTRGGSRERDDMGSGDARLVAMSFVVLVTVAAGTAPGASQDRVQATLVGDSVAASISYVPAAQSQLERGLSVTLDARVCRRLVQASCSHQGSTPTTALQAVQRYGRRLGDVLVMDVGYNESWAGYRSGIDRVVQAALRQGAKRVVWVTLRETSTNYHRTNVAIERAADRWSELLVADWNAYSRDEAWFASDGLHLTSSGARALASFLRSYVVRAARVGRSP
jgi:hypothetical protein